MPVRRIARGPCAFNPEKAAIEADPVLLPNVYSGKDKTFFFFSYQSTVIKRAPVSVQ